MRKITQFHDTDKPDPKNLLLARMGKVSWLAPLPGGWQRLRQLGK